LSQEPEEAYKCNFRPPLTITGSGDWFGLSLSYGILKHERPELLTRIRRNGTRFVVRAE
jgi:hypothetical protein